MHSASDRSRGVCRLINSIGCQRFHIVNRIRTAIGFLPVARLTFAKACSSSPLEAIQHNYPVGASREDDNVWE